MLQVYPPIYHPHRYMTHRCKFLDSCEDSLRDKPDLKAVLLKTMLSEISGFCDTEKPYHQVGYVCTLEAYHMCVYTRGLPHVCLCCVCDWCSLLAAGLWCSEQDCRLHLDDIASRPAVIWRCWPVQESWHPYPICDVRLIIVSYMWCKANYSILSVM